MLLEILTLIVQTFILEKIYYVSNVKSVSAASTLDFENP